MSEVYKTLATSGFGEYKEKGSKFLAYAYRVDDEEEVKKHLDELRKKYCDARHHCYAFILNPAADHYRAADDGEPSHSAGDPILGQIRSFELTNTLVVVVRYFGGTKLGVGGLIHAYKEAAAGALASCKVVEEKVRDNFRLIYSYDDTSEAMRLLDDLDIEVKEQLYEVKCTLIGAVFTLEKDQLKTKVDLLKNLGHDIALDFF